jgi:protein-S-isoprenylcysteine O-methyltransferase Ste14
MTVVLILLLLGQYYSVYFETSWGGKKIIQVVYMLQPNFKIWLMFRIAGCQQYSSSLHYIHPKNIGGGHSVTDLCWLYARHGLLESAMENCFFLCKY